MNGLRHRQIATVWSITATLGRWNTFDIVHPGTGDGVFKVKSANGDGEHLGDADELQISASWTGVRFENFETVYRHHMLPDRNKMVAAGRSEALIARCRSQKNGLNCQ